MPINNITQTISTIPPAGARGVDVQTIFVTKQEDFQDHLVGTTVTELNTFKDQLNSRIGEINSTTTTMNGYTSTASVGASTATTKAGEASTSASEALTSRNQASTFATNSSNSATKASQWADNNYNVAVETGKYSAKHWSTVAQNAVANKVDKITSIDNAIVRFDGVTGDVQNSGVIIDDGGNVGIGLTNPGDRLAVKGNAAITSCVGTTASDGSGVLFYRGSDNSQMAYVGFSGGITPFEFVNSKNNGFNFYNGEILQKTAYGLGYGTGSGGTFTQPPTNGKATTVTLNKPTGVIIMNNAALAAGGVVAFTFYNTVLGVGDTITVNHINANGVNGINYNSWGNIASAGTAYIVLKNISGVSLSEAVEIEFTITKGARS